MVGETINNDLKQIITSLGGSPESLEDNLLSTKLNKIIEILDDGGIGGGTVKSVNDILPDENGNVNVTDVPESVVKDAVDDYVAEHSAGFATEAEIEALNEDIVDIFENKSNPTPLNEIPSVVTKALYSANAYNGDVYLTANSSYDTYYFVTTENCDIFFKTLVGSYVALVVGKGYTGTSTSGDNIILDTTSSIRYRNTENNLPTETNKLSVSAGDVIVVTCNKGKIENLYGLDNEKVVKKSFSQEVYNNVSKAPYFRYKTETGGHYIEKVEVFVPATVGYIRYDFGHSVDTSINSDVWRIDMAYACDEQFNQRYALTTSGEWECAVKLRNGTDFSGGAMHGDEVMEDITFIVDGLIKDITTYTQLTRCDSLLIVQTSKLYNADVSGEVIAIHGSEHIFKSNGVNLKQSLIWQGQFTLNNSFLAMLPMAKTVSNKLYCDTDFVVEELPQVIEKKNVRAINIFEGTLGVNTFFDISEYPSGMDTTGDYFLCTDNGGLPYNKCYFAITASGNYITSTNEVWKAQTNYTFDVTI